MAGLGMRDIKRRIKSVNNIKQITKAMELVSSAKLKRAREELEKTKPYFNALEKTIQDIFTNTKGIEHQLINGRKVKKSLYVVITGERGLCGGYNTNVIRKAVNHMATQGDSTVIALGAKGREYFKRNGYSLEGDLEAPGDLPTYGTARSITSLLLELYRQELVDQVYLVYTEFVSMMNQTPKIIKLLPLEVKEGHESKGSETLTLYEPSPEAVLDYLVPKYLEGMIYGALIESSTSEQAATRIAMENATDNAEEMIDDLKLKYNRARQASITQEITEIVGGAEALK